jgi:2-methylcitrate dehydratase PrpD
MTAEKVGITEEIAKFVVNSCYEDLPSEILHIAKLCMIDGIGVILAGFQEPCVRILRDYVLSTEGRKESTLLGPGKIRVPLRFAALINGTAGHAMDWDDTAISSRPDRGVLLHPTVPPLAAGLAL